MRDEIDSDTTAYTGNTMTLPTNGKPIATTRVMYLNREGSDADIRKMAVDGWYYLVVKLGASDAGAGGVPVKIDVAVAGTKVSGPEYGTSGTPEPTASETPVTSPSSTWSPESGSGNASGPIDGRSSDDSSNSTLPWVIGGAAVLLAAAGVATALILRGRRPQQPTWPN